MKVVILCGGKGTRLGSSTETIPKTLALVSGKPIIWHIMNMYARYGFNEFILPLGFGGDKIKEYFWDYEWKNCDFTKELGSDKVTFLSKPNNLKVTFIDTGIDTMTGGRIKKAQEYIGNESFMLTYGDGVSNVNIPELIKSHKESRKLVTMTAVQPSGKFGALAIKDDNMITSFIEKPKGDKSWINGGFFVCEPKAFDYIQNGDSTIWERQPLEALAKAQQLNAFKHGGFWQPMDTLRDKMELTNLWTSGKAPWALWQQQELQLTK